MPTTCLVCDQPAYVWIGGVPLCRIHEALVRSAIGELRMQVKPVNVAEVVLDLKKKAKELEK